MKSSNLFACACLWLIIGCAPTLPLDANLTLSVATQPVNIYPDGSAISLRGHDGREYQEVVRYLIKDDPPVPIPNHNPPHAVIAEQLADGLREQGLVFSQQAPVHLELAVEELLATVTKPKVLYDIKAVSAVSITITGHGDSLTKRYRKESTRVSVTRPGLDDLEPLLNEQLSRIVQQVLEDREIRKLIVDGK
ncbi:YajG family lipoprotein [bacterium]|nr:YajG family lipoprotein [bacterium]